MLTLSLFAIQCFLKTFIVNSYTVLGRNFDRGFHYIGKTLTRAKREKFLGHAHLMVTTPIFVPFMALVTMDMVSDHPPVCIIWNCR